MSSDGMPPVLMYHSVAPDQHDGSLWTVRLKRFDQQMRWLRRRGRKGVSMRELLNARRAGSAQRMVGLTFDDGYADFAEYALPVLQRCGFTATLFVVAGRLGGENVWANMQRKSLITSEQLRQVAAAEIEIGSHGLYHVSLPTVTDANLAGEIEESRRILQDISGQDVPGFCYPYGNHDGRVVSRVQAAGYDYGCADELSEFTGRYALPRIYIGDADSSARLWAKGAQHRMRRGYRGRCSRLIHPVGDP